MGSAFVTNLELDTDSDKVRAITEEETPRIDPLMQEAAHDALKRLEQIMKQVESQFDKVREGFEQEHTSRQAEFAATIQKIEAAEAACVANQELLTAKLHDARRERAADESAVSEKHIKTEETSKHDDICPFQTQPDA